MVISSPSGGGKTTVIQRILNSADDRFRYSVSLTTRPKRDYEVDGKDYRFVTEEEFNRVIQQDGLVEHERVHNWLYGTPRALIETWLENGLIVFFDVDVRGAFSIRKRYDKSAWLIFIKPPNLTTLVQRLKKRGTETDKQVKKRMERVPEEMRLGEQFDDVVINRDIEETTQKVLQIIMKKYQEINK